MLDKVAFDPLGTAADRSGERPQSYVAYLAALAIYLCSRLVVFLGVVFGKTYIALGNDTWLGGEQWYHRLLRWDSEWYKIIASEGYTYSGDPTQTQSVVFYPLYPGLCRLVGEILRIDLIDSMLLVANLAAMAAALLPFTFDPSPARIARGFAKLSLATTVLSICSSILSEPSSNKYFSAICSRRRSSLLSLALTASELLWNASQLDVSNTGSKIHPASNEQHKIAKTERFIIIFNLTGPIENLGDDLLPSK